MAGQEKVLEKKRGRPAIGKGVQLNTQLRPEMAEALDAWAADQPDAPARPEAIRRVLTEHLGATGHLGPVGQAVAVQRVLPTQVPETTRDTEALNQVLKVLAEHGLVADSVSVEDGIIDMAAVSAKPNWQYSVVGAILALAESVGVKVVNRTMAGLDDATASPSPEPRN